MNAEFYLSQLNRRSQRGGFRHKFVVEEAHAGLLYRHGVFVRQINAGRHVIWGFGWTLNTMDLRKTSIAVPGQDVLTSDNVGLKLSLVVA
jgi:regulator of protease activity HflC (stomatin/prohibitin superfamily)